MSGDAGARRRVGIAVDIGGSKIASAESSAPDVVHTVATDAGQGPDGVGSQVVAAIQYWNVSPGERIVVASAGELNRSAGRIVAAANLPWRDYPLADVIADTTGCEIELVGDATAAALAELTHPSRAHHRTAIYVTVSTGIGMGAIRNGRLDWEAGIADRELGHVRVNAAADAAVCGCGRRGCLEAYSSGSAIVRRYRESAGSEDGGPKHHTVAGIIDAGRQGDPAARRVLDEALDHLADALAATVADVSAELLVLGGGVIVHTDLFRLVRSRLHTAHGRGFSVERSVYAGHSTIRGAAALCERRELVMSAWGEGGLAGA